MATVTGRHFLGLDDVCERCGLTRAFIVAADVPPLCELEVPDLNDISAELAEHSARHDHALDYAEVDGWYCRTCDERGA